MHTDIQVFQSLKKALPADIRPSISRRIRRIPALWSALHDEEFLKKAVSFAGSDPMRWRPGPLGLLLASEIEYLRSRFAKSNGASSGIPEASLIRAETALQENHGMKEPALDQAALSALALAGKIDLSADSDILEDIPPLVAGCLYTIAPDSRKVVERLAGMLPESAPMLLEVLLSNETIETVLEILEQCLPAAGWVSAAALCDSAAELGEPGLARRLGTAVAQMASQNIMPADSPEKRILRARLLRLAGENGAALPEADAARKDAKRMLLDTLAESARAAEAEGNFTTALSFWQEAGALSPHGAGFRAGIARSLSGLGRDEEALAALPSATEDPDDLLLMARIQLKTGKIEQAIDAARQSYARSSGDIHPRRHLELSDVLAECGDLRGAAQVLTAVSRIRPNHPEVFARLADLYARIGDWHACANAAASAWHLNPDDDRSLRLLARSAEQENRPREAAELYRQLSARATDDPEILLALARSSLASGDAEQAHQAAERTLTLQPDCGSAHAILGLVDLAQGREDKAFAELQKATRLAPTDAAPWKALADMHATKGNREAAVTTLRAGIESADDPADLLLALGRMLIGDGRLREAVSVLERALSIRPADTEILIALAETALGLKEHTDAEEYLNRALAVSPALLPAVKLLTSLLKTFGRFSDARTILERAVAADPQSPQLLIELGSLLVDMIRNPSLTDSPAADTALSILLQAEKMLGSEIDSRLQSLIGWALLFANRLPEAASLFGGLLQSAEQLDAGRKAEAHRGLAEAMLRSGDFPTAIHNLQAALQLSKDDSGLRQRLGEAFAASGLHADAQKEFRKILSAQPENVPALSGLASSLESLHRSDEAADVLRQAAELDPANPELPIRLAELFLRAGDGSQTRTALAKSLELAGTGNAAISLRAGRILSTLKEYAEAASVLENAIERNPDAVALLSDLGASLRHCGQNARAFDVFRRASELQPENAVHLASAADALWSDGRKSAALAFLKKAVRIDPQNAALLRKLAGGMDAVGLSGDALPHYEQAIALAPSDAALAFEAAQAAFRAGDIEKADLWKKAGAQSAAASADGPILRARISLAKGAVDEAVAACRQAVADYPADARCWALMSISLADQAAGGKEPNAGDEDPLVEAESALEKAAELGADSAEAMRMTGEAALRLDAYAVAVRCLESLCRSVPDDPEGHALFAEACIRREEASYLAHLAGASVEPDDPSAVGVSVRASLARAAALGMPDENLAGLSTRAALAFSPPDPKMIESLEDSVRTDPTPEVAAAIGRAWLRAGEPERAIKSAELAVHLDPEHENNRTLLAVCEWKSGKSDSALASLDQATRSAPRRALPHALSAAILSEQNRRDEAAAELRRAVQISPENAAWQHRLGTWQDEMGDRAAALPCLQRAAALEPLNGAYHRSLAQALMRDGDPSTALVHFRKAAHSLADEHGDLQAEIGAAAVESGVAAEAYEAFRQAQRMAGAKVPFGWRLGMARAALALGQRKEARSIAQDVLNGEGHPPAARILLAEIDEVEGRLPEAIRQLDHAASEMEDPVLPALRLARLWNATGDTARSCAAMQTLVEAHPENDEGQRLLAESLMAADRLEDALRASQKAAELAPRKADNWIVLGRIARSMGQLDQSLAALTRAREIAPQDHRTALECGLTYEAEQRWDLALDSYRTGLALAPENAALHYRMGVVHKNLREYSEAAGELRKAVQYEPQNLAAHTLLSGVMALSLVYGIVPQTAEAR